MTFAYDEELLSAVEQAMQEPVNEPLPAWLCSMFAKTDDLMATLNTYRFQSKQDVMDALGIDYGDVLLMAQIATRLQLIASNIECREAPKFKVVR